MPLPKPPNSRLFRRVLKHWFWDFYDHLFRLLLINLLMALVLGGAFLFWLMWLGQLAAAYQNPALAAFALFASVAFLLPIGITLWFAPVGYFAEQISAEKDPGWGTFWEGIRLASGRVWRYAQALCLLLAILGLNGWFYSFSGTLPESIWWLKYFLGGLCFWLGLFLVWTMQLGLPLTIRGRVGVAQAMKLSASTLARYTGLTLSVFLLIASLWVIGIAFRFLGPLLFLFSGTVLLWNALYDVLIEYEEELEEERNPRPRPTNWAEVKAEEARDEEKRLQKARYDRGMRDILRPWEQ